MLDCSCFLFVRACEQMNSSSLLRNDQESEDSLSAGLGADVFQISFPTPGPCLAFTEQTAHIDCKSAVLSTLVRAP